MRKIFDCRCSKCDNIDEVFGRFEDSFRCSQCGAESKRIISPIRCSLEGTSGDFPGAPMKWEREHIRAGRNNG